MTIDEVKTIYFAEVIWFSGVKGIGFLQWSIDGVQQKDMFVHYSDIVMQGYKTLNKGARVSFQVGVNHHGDPKAILVTVLSD